MMVLDADPPLGMDTLRDLEAKHGPVPRTYTVRTPRGGFHWWFIGDGPSSVQKLGPKLDTRGRGGYVLLPPSVVNGNPYVVTDDHDFAPLPEWVTQTLNAKEEHHVSGADLDLPHNIARARNVLAGHIAEGDVAIEGSGGDARTLQQALELRDLGVGEETALRLLIESGWNAACQPPWDEDELATKVANAYRYAQNEAGAYAAPPPAEAFADFMATQPKPKETKSKFYAYSENEQEDWPEPSWLVPEVLPDEATVMMFGPSRSFKSFLALDLALGLAYGKETFGHKREPVPTLFIAGESPRGLSRQRRPAWKLAREAEGNGQFYMIKTMPSILNGGIAALREQLREQGLKPRLIVIDTLAKAMAGMNENDARDAGAFIEGMEALRDEFGATILLIHHTGKDTDRGARGSSAFFNGFDAALEVERGKSGNTVAVSVRKMKDADERETPWAFEAKMVGPGLVLFPMDSDNYAKMNTPDDPLSKEKVGAALQKLRAYGEENGVTSMALASELIAPVEGEPAEARAATLTATARKLVKRSHERLEAYTTGRGHDLRWSLPKK